MMPAPLDRAGLTNMASTLGLIADAVRSHQVDAVEREDYSANEKLSMVRANISEAISGINEVLERETG